MARFVSDALRIMRIALGRRNENDPDASDETLLSYLNDFVSLTMSDDVKLFENFSTFSFTIDELNTSGVYTIAELEALGGTRFVNLSQEAFISLLDPVNNSVSWNVLPIWEDPGQFFSIWGINNDEILIPGYPTAMLYYGTEFTFRTIPNTSYLVKIYGYKQLEDYSTTGDPVLQKDLWLRYISYGAALNYAQDYRYEEATLTKIQRGFMRERKLRLANTHNQIKTNRCLPRF